MEDIPARTLTETSAVSGWNLSDLLGVLKTSVARVITALRAFGRAFRTKPEKQKTDAHRYGAYTSIEEAKYHSPAPPPQSVLDDGELPESYGETKVILLVVNPYLVHVYWDWDPAKLPGTYLRRPLQPQMTPALLRFYDAAGAPSPVYFDVEVDLQARNWYVHLWSPDKSYYVELGVSTEGGRFTALARSNTVQTPRAWPVAELDEHFIRAGEGPQRVEVGPPRPAESVPPQMQVLGGDPIQQQRGESQQQRGESPGMAKPPGMANPAASVEERPPAPRIPQPVDVAELLRKRLSELYALRWWRPQPATAPVSGNPGSSPATKREAQGDLTALAEQHFSPGLSSALQGSQEPERPTRSPLWKAIWR